MTTRRTLTQQDLKELIVENYDPDVVIELLDLSTETLLDRFEDVMWDRRYQFGDLYD